MSKFELPSLPYSSNAEESLNALNSGGISKETLEYHYGKHHKTYVDKLNGLIGNSEDYDGKNLEEVIEKSSADKNAVVFNNAAQVWNHTFYWHCMSPKPEDGKLDGDLNDKILRDFGDKEKFLEQFNEAAITQFGSGWAWLVLNEESDKLEIVKTNNAESPLTMNGRRPLLTVDVWEHAYYVDHRNARPKYLEDFKKLINWNFVNRNLEKEFTF